MSFFEKRKRKNDDPPRFPAWILVLIAIGLVIIVEMVFQPATVKTTEVPVQEVVVTASPNTIELTGTYIIDQATAMAQGTPQPVAITSTLDALEMTVTYIVQQATNEALGTPQPASSNLDPIEQTATYIVKLATEQTKTPGS